MYGGGSCSRSSSWDDDKMMWTTTTKLPKHKGGGATGRRHGGGEEAKGKLRRSVSMGGRLASAAREQRARLYIMRRCVSMLVRWKD
ncbi:hypothetical protein GQ55_8G261900 [Panicum hallii var. hallii]|jgi:hypothetical protein|uniref:ROTUNDIFOLIA like 8 n=2 Tax=Panicum hallii TaxID=206008 RepID=A0A2T7CRE2_9POAL|nr:hypothetical protein GQ55_8G261900 [Panicum hallii var. hallii]PVH34651.1 hypothetical protein PAHAL_8G267100 [Panicum hallii]